jgi:hypothetical protein
MRKLSLSLMTVLFSIALVFTGCAKDETASPVNVNMSKTATLKGYVNAQLDASSVKLERKANAQIKISVAYSALTNSSDQAGDWTKTVETDADGIFTVEVPTTDAGVTVYYDPISFEATVPQTDPTPAKNTLFTYSKSNVSLVTGETQVVEFSYTATAIGNK